MSKTRRDVQNAKIKKALREGRRDEAPWFPKRPKGKHSSDVVGCRCRECLSRDAEAKTTMRGARRSYRKLVKQELKKGGVPPTKYSYGYAS
jgi:hypothetical protein